MAKIDVKFYRATCSSNTLPINYWQANLSCESIINTAFYRSSVN